MGNWYWNGFQFERATQDVVAPSWITVDDQVYVLMRIQDSERPAYMPWHGLRAIDDELWGYRRL